MTPVILFPHTCYTGLVRTDYPGIPMPDDGLDALKVFGITGTNSVVDTDANTVVVQMPCWLANAWRVKPVRITYANINIGMYCFKESISQIAVFTDSSMTAEDVEGATIMKLSDDGDGWIFQHSEAGVHHDHIIHLRNSVNSLFSPYLEALTIKRFEATNKVARGRVETKYSNLCEFRDAVVKEGIKVEQSRHLGWYVQNEDPAIGHLHASIKAALAAQKLAYAATPTLAAKYRNISDVAAEIIAEMATPHTVKHRAVIAAEEAAKKAAEAAAMETPAEDPA